MGLFTGSPHGAPNHCLVNEYKPGEGIHKHEDGGAYWPVVCTVSLGGHIVLDVGRKAGESSENQDGGKKELGQWRILQERRSLLITTGEVYGECLHGIEGVSVDERLGEEDIANWNLLGGKEVFERGSKERDTRVSLTFRDVIKVKKIGKALNGWIK